MLIFSSKLKQYLINDKGRK